jgi:SAM-dependent methyltransferase
LNNTTEKSGKMALPDLPCIVCSKGNYALLPFGYKFKGKELRGIKCLTCGLIFIHPQPAPAEIKTLYDENYFTSTDVAIRPHGRADYLRSVANEREERVYQQRLAKMASYQKPGKLLEIGCGPGHFLKSAQRIGWEVTGVEISDFAAKYARDQFGLEVFTGTIEAARLPEYYYDLIFMGDLLEHIPEPVLFLKRVSQFLKNEGIVYIEVPAITNGIFSRFGSLLMKSLGKVKFINLPPYHLYEYTPRNIRTLLRAAGYTVLKLEQKAVAPKDIGLHDNMVLNVGKMSFQSVNFLLTSITGRFGDRLVLVAKKKG